MVTRKKAATVKKPKGKHTVKLTRASKSSKKRGVGAVLHIDPVAVLDAIQWPKGTDEEVLMELRKREAEAVNSNGLLGVIPLTSLGEASNRPAWTYSSASAPHAYSKVGV